MALLDEMVVLPAKLPMLVLFSTVNAATVTPHAEAFQGVIWHLIVSDPRMRVAEMKWESVK